MEFDYKVVSVDDADHDEMIGALQNMVKINVNDGWRPLGGVSVIYMAESSLAADFTI